MEARGDIVGGYYVFHGFGNGVLIGGFGSWGGGIVGFDGGIDIPRGILEARGILGFFFDLWGREVVICFELDGVWEGIYFGCGEGRCSDVVGSLNETEPGPI